MIKICTQYQLVIILAFGPLISVLGECIKDCYSHTYSGIRSVAAFNDNCRQWSNIDGYTTEKSNFCLIGSEKKPWCFTESSWKFCDVPACSYSNNQCVQSVRKSVTHSSISVLWDSSNIFLRIKGYIILLHKNDNCLQYNMQMGHSRYSDEYNFYQFCKLNERIYHVTGNTAFNNLQPNTDYYVYIVTVFDDVRTKEIFRESVTTSKLVPGTPRNVQVGTSTLRSLSFTWTNDWYANVKAEYYLATLTKSVSNYDMEQRVYHTRVEFKKLDLCSEYCLRLTSVRESERSEPITVCARTLVPELGTVKVNDIMSGPSSDRVISWRYSGEKGCPIYYRIQYGINSIKQTNCIESNYTDVVLSDLRRNVMYSVVVRAESRFSVLDNVQYGQYSAVKQFYTGQVKPEIDEYIEYVDYFGSQLNISWNIGTFNTGSIFEFVIRLLDSSRLCLSSINLLSSSSPHHYNRTYLNTANSLKRFSLLKCRVNSEQTFEKDTKVFKVTLEKKKSLKYFSTEIYAVNLAGVQKVYNKLTIYRMENSYSHYLQLDTVFNNMDTMNSKVSVSLAKDNTSSKVFQLSDKLEAVKIVCPLTELIPLCIIIDRKGSLLKIPFNISCGVQHLNNVINNLTNKVEEGILHIFWNVTNIASNYYIIYWMNTEQFQYRYLKSDLHTFNVTLSYVKNWHQICIAIIDISLRTNSYVCTQYSFSPGPVTDLKGLAGSRSIHLSWHTSNDDLHHGYIVNVTSTDKYCQTIIINMEPYSVNVEKHCHQLKVLRWRNLKSVKIENLVSYKTYTVTVYSTKGNQTSLPTFIEVSTTKKDLVRDLRISRNYSNLLINFTAPTNCDNKTIEYNLKVTSRGLHMCNYDNRVIYDNVINTTSVAVYANRSLNCSKIRVDITPLRQCVLADYQGELNVTNKRHIFLSSLREEISFGSNDSLLSTIWDIAILSVNLLKVSWRSAFENECDSFDLLVESTKLSNASDCMLWIISRKICSALLAKIDKESNCTKREYLIFNDQVINKVVLLHRLFGLETIYTVKVWIIDDQMSQIFTRQIKYENKRGCFNDCFDSSYGGIRSGTVDGRICAQWKHYVGSIESVNYRSNVCHYNKSVNNVPWCIYGRHGHHINCDIPNCRNQSSSTINDKCTEDLPIDSSKQSITIQLPSLSNSVRGYIILLHNTEHDCQRYVITTCTNCIRLLRLSSQIQGLYLACKVGSVLNYWTNNTTFNSLHSNTVYFLYIVPLLDYTTTGAITNITIATRASDSMIPHKITVSKRNSTSLRFVWNSYVKGNATIFPLYYSAILINMWSKEEADVLSPEEMVEFDDLDACTKYCLDLSVEYSNGASEVVDRMCTYTLLASQGPIKVYGIESGPSPSRIVSWAYLGSDRCPKIYTVEISNAYKDKVFYKTTNETNLFVDDLETDMSYMVKVRIETHMNEEVIISEYSEAQRFYNGEGLGLTKLDNIESGPSLEKTLTWRYSRYNQDDVYFRIEYYTQFSGPKLNMTSDLMTANLSLLQSNVFYNVRVRAETRNRTNNEITVGNYSEIKKFFSGRSKITISDVVCHIDSPRKMLNIYWILDDTSEGSIFEFIVRILNRSNHCTESINLISTSSTEIYARKYVNEPAQIEWKKSITCGRSKQKRFKFNAELFGVKIQPGFVLVNSTLTIHGLNLRGLHKLYETVLHL